MEGEATVLVNVLDDFVERLDRYLRSCTIQWVMQVGAWNRSSYLCWQSRGNLRRMVDRKHDIAPHSCAEVIQIFTRKVVSEGLRDGRIGWRRWIVESYHPWAFHWNIRGVSHCLGRTLVIIIFLLAIAKVPGRIVRVLEKVWCLPTHRFWFGLEVSWCSMTDWLWRSQSPQSSNFKLKSKESKWGMQRQSPIK